MLNVSKVNSVSVLKTLLMSAFALFIFPFLTSDSVDAADTRDFNAEKIISDQVFTDYGSMSIQKIQSFLVAKNSVCLVNFQTQSLRDDNNDGLGDEPYGGGTNEKVSAAKLIWQAAQLYQISPKVILATLEKEQGLVTRTDCPSWRYNTALGYGCPDSAPCDDSAYGFTRQIDYGVWHLRGFFDDDYPIPPITPGTRAILYNPNTSCGSKTIAIRNRATAALYSYTPYQPNAAAIAASPGQVVSCGAYGNLNFWRYFTDWFGSTLGTPFFRVDGGKNVYISGADNTYYKVLNNTVLAHFGYPNYFNYIENFSSSYTSSKTYGGLLKRIVRFEGASIYAIQNTTLRNFPSRELFEDEFGFTMDTESQLPAWLLEDYTISGSMQTILKLSDASPVFLIESGVKRHISSSEAFSTLGIPIYNQRASVTFDADFAATINDGAPIVVDGSLLYSFDEMNTYLWSAGELHSVSATLAANFPAIPRYSTTQDNIDLLPMATGSLSNLIKDSGGNFAIIDTDNKKIRVDSAFISSVGLNESDFIQVSDKFLGKLATITVPPLIRVNGGNTIYQRIGVDIYRVASREDLEAMGYSINSPVNIASATYSLFNNTGLLAFGQGRLLRVDQGSDIYVINNDSRLRIPSREIFDAFGYSLNNVLNVASTQITQYAIDSSHLLSHFVRDSSGTEWLIYGGHRHKIKGDLVSEYPTSTSTPLSTTNVLRLPISHNALPFVKQSNGNRVYKLENGLKRWIKSESTLATLGGNSSTIDLVPQSIIDVIPSGPSIP